MLDLVSIHIKALRQKKNIYSCQLGVVGRGSWDGSLALQYLESKNNAICIYQNKNGRVAIYFVTL